MIKLSDLKLLNNETIRNDGEFDNLGLLKFMSDRILVNFYDESYLHTLLQNPHISCIITTKALAHLFDPNRYGILISENPNKTFYNIHDYLLDQTEFYWKNFSTKIGKFSKIHPRAIIAENNVSIGEHCIIEANVVINEHTLIGDHVIIRAGTILGGEGFEFKTIDKKVFAVRHAGGVKINDNVEIQYNCTVDKSVFKSFTEIGANTKIDNLVYIAHNNTIGTNCRIAGSAAILGSSTIGNNVWIGPNSSVSSEIIIGNEAKVTIGAVVTRDVAEGQRVSGNFAVDHSKFIPFLKRFFS